MDEKIVFIVVTDESLHRFSSYAEFCSFMSENSHLLIHRIEKLED